GGSLPACDRRPPVHLDAQSGHGLPPRLRESRRERGDRRRTAGPGQDLLARGPDGAAALPEAELLVPSLKHSRRPLARGHRGVFPRPASPPPDRRPRGRACPVLYAPGRGDNLSFCPKRRLRDRVGGRQETQSRTYISVPLPRMLGGIGWGVDEEGAQGAD